MIVYNMSRARDEFVEIRDGDILWTMTSSGHFFFKWVNFRGHSQRMNSRGHFLVNSSGHFCSQKVLFFGEFSWNFFW